MNRLNTLMSGVLACVTVELTGGETRAAEIIFFAPRALQTTLSELVPQFEHSSKHKITMEYGSAGGLTERLQRGEFADVAIVSSEQFEELEKGKQVVAGSTVGLAKVGIALMVRPGTAKRDVSSIEAFKASMLAATSITYTDPRYGGPAGMYMFSLFDRIGIGAEMKAKTKLVAPAAPLYETVVSGQAEIGFDQLSQVIAESKVEFAGVLPQSIQNYTKFSVGIAAAGRQLDGAKQLIAFLSSPAAAVIMKTKGFEPL